MKSLLTSPESKNVTVSSLTTDWHRQVRAYIKKEKPNINDQSNIWNVGKNIKKKFVANAKINKCQDLNARTFKGGSIELREKWLSLLNRLSNIHSWDNKTILKKYADKKLTKREALKKFLLSKQSPAYQALERIVTNKSLLSDLKYFISFNHAGNLEVYHSLYSKYCPTRLHFFDKVMVARSQLAIMDFNSDVNRKQATTKTGDLRYSH